MTLRLILTRHAKSSWSDLALSDHARPLNKRGRASAEAIGAWLAARAPIPDQVLCSDAARTRETWGLIAGHLAGAPEEELSHKLYLASAGAMLASLHQATTPTVMMVAHNPGTAALATQLAAQPHPHPKFSHYPSGATAIFEFDASVWGEVRPHSGRVCDFVVPRELI